MFNIFNKNNKQNKGKSKRLPLFSIIIIAGFVVLTAILFIHGMNEAPGRTRQGTEESPPVTDAPSPTPTPPPTPAEPTIPPMPPAVKVKGIYYIIEYMNRDSLENCLDAIESTDLNAIVLDVKDDFGNFTFATDNEVLASASAAHPGSRITSEQIADMKERGIYTIARVVCFRDNRLALENPELAFKNANGNIWRDGRNRDGFRWLDPYNRENWDYILEVCKEAARIGFDEIQLDYVRFPIQGHLGDIVYSPEAELVGKAEIINEFVAFIREGMLEFGVRTSADIFGVVGLSNLDAAALGQDVQLLLGSADSLCPMIYPSHWARGQVINGVVFEAPDTEPYDVVYNVLQHYRRHVDQFVSENPNVEPAVVRPYLQYFTASWLGEDYFIPYEATEIQAQIQAVYDAGFDEWILWKTANSFDALLEE